MKVKSVLCMLLALTLVFALAIPAFAADGGDEGIEPYGQVISCPRCNGSATVEHFDTTTLVTVPNCQNHPANHAHYLRTVYDAYNCNRCGYWESTKRYTTTCPYA